MNDLASSEILELWARADQIRCDRKRLKQTQNELLKDHERVMWAMYRAIREMLGGAVPKQASCFARQGDIAEGTRQHLMEEAKGRCEYCGCGPTKDNLLDIDHIVPVAENGVPAAWNLVVTCGRCNRKKGDRQTRESLELLFGRVEKAREWRKQHPALFVRNGDPTLAT